MIFEPLERDVLRKVPLFGPALAKHLLPSKKKEPSFSGKKVLQKF